VRDPTFSRFDTIPECDRLTDTHTDRHKMTAYTVLSIASHGKNAKMFKYYFSSYFHNMYGYVVPFLLTHFYRVTLC